MSGYPGYHRVERLGLRLGGRAVWDRAAARRMPRWVAPRWVHDRHGWYIEMDTR